MDTLHHVLRAIRGETKTRREHVSVFREFVSNLDRISKPAPPRTGSAKPKAAARKGGKR